MFIQSLTLSDTQIKSIKLDPNDIKIDYDTFSSRRMFYNVQYTEYELQQIQILKQELINNKIDLKYHQSSYSYLSWPDQKLLKYCYSGQFNISKCINNIKLHLSWLNNPSNKELSDKAKFLLEDGVAYQFGRDIKFRPIIYFQVRKIIQHLNDPHSLIESVCYLLMTIEKSMLVDGYVENWIIVMDIDNLGMYSLPVKAIQQVIEATSVNFCSRMDQMFILNPSFTLKTGWNMISSKKYVSRFIILEFLSPGTQNKIMFLTTSQFDQLNIKIPKTQLESKYKGQAANLSPPYWPPKNSLSNGNQDHISQSSPHAQTIYYSINDSKTVLTSLEDQFYSFELLTFTQQGNDSKIIFDKEQVYSSQIIQFQKTACCEWKQCCIM